MIAKSGKFDCESEIPMQCGKEVFTRKKAQIIGNHK